MNRQRYLAELRRLLVFMTEEDRDRTVQHYAGLFDEAGPEGEQALIAELGTPTRTAIRLSRGYEPGSFSIPPLGGPARDTQSARGTRSSRDTESSQDPQDTPDPGPAQTDDDFWRELLGFDMPELSAPAAETPPPRSDEGPAPEAALPRGLGAALFVLALLLLGVPAAGLFLAAMAVCAAPGCALIFGAYLAAVGGLWCSAYIADAILLYGLAFLLLGVGLIVLWFGIGLDVKLARVYARGVRWAHGMLLGEEGDGR